MASLHRQRPSLPPDQRSFTLSIAAIVEGQPRVIIITNRDRPNGRRREEPSGGLEVFSINAKRPRIILTGLREAVSRQDRRLLKSALRARRDPGYIRHLLARVNERAAAHTRFGRWISPGCMVSSLLPDGSGSAQNVGGVPGFPDEFMPGLNMGDWARRNLRPARDDTPISLNASTSSQAGSPSTGQADRPDTMTS